MTDEIAPCPFCENGGKPFPHIDRQSRMGYIIKCFVCHAQGPVVLFETDHKHTWEEVTGPAIAEATRRWNTWWARLQDVAAMSVVDPRFSESEVPRDAVVLVESTRFDSVAAERAAEQTREIVEDVLKNHSG